MIIPIGRLCKFRQCLPVACVLPFHLFRASSGLMAMASSSSVCASNMQDDDKKPGASYYSTRPLSKYFGMEVLGVDMSQVDLGDQQLIQQIKNDLVQHRALLFRNQSLAGERQVEISRALGRVESTFYKHPRSPHPDIFRVSNDEAEGCRNVGRSGYHVDGTFMMTPFQYQTMFFPSVAEGADTIFIPLKELYESVPKETQQRWNRLWMVTGRNQAPIHPLVYQHPTRKDTTMVFHCGEPFVQAWFLEAEKDSTESAAQEEEGMVIEKRLPPYLVQEELTNAIESRLDQIGMRMQWQTGDFLICDNLALAHYATEGTQGDVSDIGLRILHRTTIMGGDDTVPRKADGRSSFVI